MMICWMLTSLSCDLWYIAIFVNRKARYLYICLVPTFFLVSSQIHPAKMLMFQHVTRISLKQIIACTLRYVLLTEIVLQIFVHAEPKKNYNPCLMFTVLYYLSSKLPVYSEPGYLQIPSKII